MPTLKISIISTRYINEQYCPKYLSNHSSLLCEKSRKFLLYISRSIPILLYLNQFHLNSILNQFQLHLCQIRRYAMYCLSNLCVHIVAIQVPKQSVRNHHNLWKLRRAHSDQGICWNIAPLNFQRNDAKTHFFLCPP